MSFYEELLSLGQHLHKRERAALYRYLLETQESRYSRQADELINSGSLQTSIADGEVFYSIKDGFLAYGARKKGATELYDDIRRVKLRSLGSTQKKKIMRFFAQSEVEVLWNFPLPGVNPQEESGFTIIDFPYYDLRYYSNGRGKILGLIKKFQAKDDELLEKLLAS